MSDVGECLDNATTESFNATIKRELIDRREWSSHDEVAVEIVRYIEKWYNPRRLHSSLKYQSPVEREIALITAQTKVGDPSKSSTDSSVTPPGIRQVADLGRGEEAPSRTGKKERAPHHAAQETGRLTDFTNSVSHQRGHSTAAVVFLGHDEHKNVVGAQGRYINVNVSPKVRGAGRTSAGTFSTPGAFDTASEIAVIVEAPIDALSIFAVTGIPSIALFGTGSPSWLRRRCAFKQVLIATDADAAGERDALHLAATLTLCITVRRVQWPPGVKDANELLVRDREALRAAISAFVKPGTVLHPPTTSSRLPSTE